MCKCVYQVCFCLMFRDLTTRPIFEMYLNFYTLMYLVYYAVEHYLLITPSRLEDVPRYAVHLSFTKGLNRLGHYFARHTTEIEPQVVHRLVVPSGANTITLEYRMSESTEMYKGPLFSGTMGARRHVLDCKVIVEEYGLLPITKTGCRQAYLQERGYDKTAMENAKKLSFPALTTPDAIGEWVKMKPPKTPSF